MTGVCCAIPTWVCAAGINNFDLGSAFTEAAMSPADYEGRSWLDVTANAGITYDDNIFLDSSGEEEDLISRLSLKFSLNNSEDVSNQWAVLYTPKARFYADNSDLDGYDHALKASFTKVLPKTELSVDASYDNYSGANEYVGGFTDASNWDLSASARHLLTGKIILDAKVSYSKDTYDSTTFLSRESYKASLAALYELSGKINVGPYVSYGERIPEAGIDHRELGAGIAIDYRPTGKIDLSGKIGYTETSYSGASAGPDDTNLQYEIGMNYQMTGKTSLTASLYRNSDISYRAASLGRSGFDATGISIGASHQLTGKITLKSDLIYEQTDYYSVAAGGSPTLPDADYISVRLSGDYRLKDDLTLGSSILYRDNSRDGASSYNNLQLGLDLNYTF